LTIGQFVDAIAAAVAVADVVGGLYGWFVWKLETSRSAKAAEEGQRSDERQHHRLLGVFYYRKKVITDRKTSSE
jgi:hypothetical protein